MTVTTENKRNQYSCDGAQTVFPYTFRILHEDHIQVILTDSSGDETILTKTTHYSVSGVGNQGGGNITTVSTYASGNKLTFLRKMPLTQLTDYVENDEFPAQSHEDALDRAIMILQEYAEKLDRVIFLAKSSAYSGLEFPDPVAQKILQWKDDLSGLKNVSIYSEGNLTVTDFIETLLDDEDVTEAFATLGLDDDLRTLSLPASVTISAFIKTLLDDADAATARATLGALLRRNFADVYAVASGTDTYTATLSPAITSYETGMHYFITFTNANTAAAPTLNLNSLGAKTIKKKGSAVLLAGDIPASHAAVLKYDGTDMILLNPAKVSTPEIHDLAVTEGKLADSAVAQAKLKTSTGSVNTALTSWQPKTMPGGEYGFYPQVKGSTIGANFWFNAIGPPDVGLNCGTSYVTILCLKVSDVAYTAYAQQRYVTSSGEQHWIFLLRDKLTGRIVDGWQAPDHPCFGCGGKPLLLPQPHIGYDSAIFDLIVITPSPAEVKAIQEAQIVADENKPDKDFLEAIWDVFDIDDLSTPEWPTMPITVGLPPDWDEAWRTGRPVTPIKKVIPKPVGIIHRSLKDRI